jgi:hypothetical protein
VPSPFAPRFRQRAISLIVGPAYLGLLTALFSHITGTPVAVTAGVVAGCTLVVLAAIGVLCVRLVGRAGPERQFGMATALLLFIPFAVYLGGIRCVLLAIQKSAEDLDPVLWFLLAAYSLMFMIVTTVVLLFFGEALIWLVALLLRRSRR